MLAAGALGANLYFAPLIFGLGLMNATSPMMAAELGRHRHSVRDIRRTVRQGLWIAVLVSIPIWLLLWNTEAILAAMGQDPELAQEAGIYVHWLQWAVLPFYGYIVLRSFMAALERPRWALVIVVIAVAFNAFANWCLIFGNLGFPRMGIAGSGLATTAVEHPDVRRAAPCVVLRAALSPLPPVRPLLARRLAALQGAAAARPADRRHCSPSRSRSSTPRRC